MKDVTKTVLMPKLRFPEFRDGLVWEERPLGQLATLTDDRVGARECIPYTVTSGSGLVSQQQKFGRVIAGNSIRNYLRLQRNDFAYNKSATKAFPQGYIARYLGDEQAAVPNSIFTCFRADEKRVDPSFLDHLFASNLHGTWLQKYLTIGARAHGALNVDDNDLMSLPVPLPGGKSSLEEQQRIADCLTSLDQLIIAHGRQLKALQAYKRGLMQQLFPHNGETLPRVRFPEFQGAPEWEDKMLSNLCERIMDGTHFSPQTKSGPRLYLTSKNVRDGRIDLSSASYISEEEHREIYNRCPVRLHDILITKDGANTGTCAINTLDFEFSLLSSVAVLRGSPSLLDQRFLYQSIVSDRTQQLISDSMSGQAIRRITLEKLGSYTIPVPSIAEQNQLADCLSLVDELFSAHVRKIDALNSHKRGLMQQLFPSREQVNV